jgi:hypothetical protein
LIASSTFVTKKRTVFKEFLEASSLGKSMKNGNPKPAPQPWARKFGFEPNAHARGELKVSSRGDHEVYKVGIIYEFRWRRRYIGPAVLEPNSTGIWRSTA